MRNLLKKWLQKNSPLSNEFELKANCLLTQSPLLLVGKNWGQIPEILKSHGYQVKTSPVLKPTATPDHLFLSEDFCPLVIKKLRLEKTYRSVTLVTRRPPENFEETIFWPDGLSPITERELWLQHVISLAERELVRED